MGIFLAILIGLFVWVFMIAPFIKIYKASRQWRDAFQQAQSEARRRQQPPRPEQSARRKKKIDPSVGEYVEFTETTEVRSSETDREHTRTTVSEQQITDVTWEDLPD